MSNLSFSLSENQDLQSPTSPAQVIDIGIHYLLSVALELIKDFFETFIVLKKNMTQRKFAFLENILIKVKIDYKTAFSLLLIREIFMRYTLEYHIFY